AGFALRERRVAGALGAVAEGDRSLSARVRAVWPLVFGEEAGLARVLDQAMGLAMYDPARYGRLGREASGTYLPTLMSFCPAHWPERRRVEVAEMILATLRGLLVERATTRDTAGIDAGFAALIRAL